MRAVNNKAVIVHIYFPHLQNSHKLSEFHTLVHSSGAEIVSLIEGSRKEICPRLFIGKGKVQEIKAQVDNQQAAIVIFNHSLSASQERNLEKELNCRVLDRTGLILDIFALRARTHEGKLQVELAQLEHLATRLVRGWTHLERQKGGIGLRGPGEKQLETDRRLIRSRIKYIKAGLSKLRNQREVSRSARKSSSVPVVALVGYTNAGKSSLFNRLTDAEVYVEDKLFATLDPTLRHTIIPGLGKVIFVDTVGFIQDLPHELIESFHATLNETIQADCLLHVIDSADELLHDKIVEVQTVLKSIGADNIPQIEVYNKIDLIPGRKQGFQAGDGVVAARVWLSVKSNSGINQLNKALISHFERKLITVTLSIPPAQFNFRSKLISQGAVLSEDIQDDGNYILKISMLRAELEKLARRCRVDWQELLLQ